MGRPGWNRRRVVSFATAIALTLSLLAGAGGVTGGQTDDAPADYTIDSVDAFDYYNSRGLEDTNDDGRVVVEITSTIDLAQSRDPVLRYGGDAPLVLRGSGAVTNTAPPLIRAGSTDDLTIQGLSIRSVPADEPYAGSVIRVGGDVTFRGGAVHNTTRLVETGSDVRIEDSTFAGTGQVVKTDGTVTVTRSTFLNADTDEHGIVHADGQVRLTDVTVRHAEGRIGGGVHAGSVVGRNVTFVDTNAINSGGAINAEGDVTLEDSLLRDARGADSGGAIDAEGIVRIVDSRLENVDYGDSAIIGEGGVELVGTRINHTGGIGGGYDGTVTVTDLTVTDSNGFGGQRVVIQNATVDTTKGMAASGDRVRVEHSTIRDTGGLGGTDTVVVDSTLRNADKIDAGGSVTVRNSTLVDFGQFTTFNEYWRLRLSNTTIHGASSPLVPAVNNQSISYVNIIEAEPPVFEARLPNKTMVFVDTTNDSEPPGEWDADVFWSRDTPFPFVDRLPASAVQTPTPTSNTTATGTAGESATDTEASDASGRTDEPATETDTLVMGDGPGFGVLSALLAAAVVVLLGRRD